MSQQSLSKTFLFGGIAIAAGVATYLGLGYFREKPNEKPDPSPQEETIKKKPKVESKTEPEKPKVDPKPNTNLNPTPEPPKPEPPKKVKVKDFSSPAELMGELAVRMNALNAEGEKNYETVSSLMSNGEVKQATAFTTALKNLEKEDRLKLNMDHSIEAIGETVIGKESTWALNLQDSSRFMIDLKRQRTGFWKVAKVKFPIAVVDENGKPLAPEQVKKKQQQEVGKNAMMYSNTFMNTLTKLDFEKARSMVNSEKISDAKIAGLCILFEEGNYKLDPKKPLQAIRMRDDISVFYANVIAKKKEGEAAEKSKGANFSLTLVRDKKEDPWTVDEINLDHLLEDYAKRVAGGDVYYTPLIKNPNGGDTLVIYFDFDSEGLTDRTKHQLNIVAKLLKLDKRKKVTLAGFTDAKGSDEYNQSLSNKRAVEVKKFLGENGVPPSQIVTEAFGSKNPRRPDTKEDGSDDPSARRANRRTEIYLDF